MVLRVHAFFFLHLRFKLRVFMFNRFLLVVVAIIAASCVYHELPPPVDCEVSGPSLQVESVVPATDCSTHDGSIHVAPSGGKPPYKIFLNGQQMPGGVFTDLAAGIYSVRVQDANGCDTLISNVAVMAEGFSFTAKIKGDSLCLEDNGSILVEVTEGNP